MAHPQNSARGYFTKARIDVGSQATNHQHSALSVLVNRNHI